MKGKELVLWGVKSVGGLALNLAFLTVWVDYLGVPPALAIFPNWLIISVLGYAFTDRVVFADAGSPRGWVANFRRYLGMQGVMAASKVANYGIYLGLLAVGVEYRVAWGVGAVVTFGLSFVGNRTLWNKTTLREEVS